MTSTHLTRTTPLTKKDLDQHLIHACRNDNCNYADLACNYADLALAVGADVNARDSGDRTPLHWVAIKGNRTIAESLLARGAHTDAKDIDGHTPRDLAHNFGSYSVVKVIDDADAKRASHAHRVTQGRSDQGPPQVGG